MSTHTVSECPACWHPSHDGDCGVHEGGGLGDTSGRSWPCECEGPQPCSRRGDGIECSAEVQYRVSRSGLTSSWMCTAHIDDLEAALDEIENRYPEINHPDGCGCWGCSEGSY